MPCDFILFIFVGEIYSWLFKLIPVPFLFPVYFKTGGSLLWPDWLVCLPISPALSVPCASSSSFSRCRTQIWRSWRHSTIRHSTIRRWRPRSCCGTSSSRTATSFLSSSWSPEFSREFFLNLRHIFWQLLEQDRCLLFRCQSNKTQNIVKFKFKFLLLKKLDCLVIIKIMICVKNALSL